MSQLVVGGLAIALVSQVAGLASPQETADKKAYQFGPTA